MTVLPGFLVRETDGEATEEQGKWRDFARRVDLLEDKFGSSLLC